MYMENALIIFDLDHTLVHSTISYNRFSINVRPHFERLFFYLNEYNYDIAFWSLGEENYVADVITYLKTKINFNPKFIISKVGGKNEFIDSISKIHFDIDCINDTFVKKISTLKKYIPIETNKIILVDDLITNIGSNPKSNVYRIKEWHKTMLWDEELITFENLLIGLRNYANY